MQGKGNGVQSGTPRSTAAGYLSEVPLAGCCSYVVYLAIGGRESQSEPAVRVIARAYMDCNYLKIDCLFLHVMIMQRPWKARG